MDLLSEFSKTFKSKVSNEVINYKKIIYNPFLKTKDDIKSLLLVNENLTAHPYQDDSKKYLIVRNGSNFKEYDITTKNPDDFLNNAEISELESIIHKNLTKFISTLGFEFKRFTLKVLNPGQFISIKVTNSSNKNIIILTDKNDGHFFDLSVYCSKPSCNYSVLTYSNRTNDSGLTHSGDIGSLCHYVKGFNSKCLNYSSFLLTVVGFRKRGLRYFKNQQPSILLADYENHLLYIVPCPLDFDSVGNNSLAHIAKLIYKSNGYLDIKILERPITVGNVDTGCLSSSVLNSIKRADETTNMSSEDVSEYLEGESSDEYEIEINYENIDDKEIKNSINFIQQGLDLNFDDNETLNIYFGDGFSKTKKETNTSLPHIFGEIVGNAGALGKLPEIVPDIEKNISIIHATTISDANSRMLTKQGNCIMYIYTNFSESNIIKKLNEANISASCMAGPNSIILINNKDKIYWYRGVRYPGLIDEIPYFGKNVSKILSYNKVKEWLKTSPKLPWEFIVSKNHQSVCYKNNMVDVPTVILDIEKMTLTNLKENENEIIDFLTQLSVLFDTQEISKFVNMIENYLIKLKEKEIKPLTDLLKKTYDEGKDVKDVVISLRQFKKDSQIKINKITKCLVNLTSVKGISKRKQSIERRLREQTIDNNVKKINDMTVEQKIQSLEEFSENMIMMVLSNGSLLKCYQHMLNFTNFIDSSLNNPKFYLDERTRYLDPSTYSSLLEITHTNSNHILKSQNNICVPRGHSSGSNDIPVIGIPILKEDIDCKNPEFRKWPDEANKSKYANYRIMLRGMLSSAPIAKQNKIQPQTKELGFFIVHMYLCAMENIISEMSNKPDPEKDWDNATCQNLRGLFCQLLSVLGSTKQTLSGTYKLVYNIVYTDSFTNLKIKDNELWICYRMMKIYDYTCWDNQFLKRNIKRLIINHIYRKLNIQQAIDNIKKGLALTKGDPKFTYSQEWYDYLRLICSVIMELAKEKKQISKKQMVNLISKTPEDISKGTRMLNDFFRLFKDIFKHLDDKSDFSNDYFKITQIALFSYIKHSSNFNDKDRIDKKKIIHTLTSVNEIYDKYKLWGGEGYWESTDSPNHDENLNFVLENEKDVEIKDTQLEIIKEKTLQEELEELPNSSLAIKIYKNIYTEDWFKLISPWAKLIIKEYPVNNSLNKLQNTINYLLSNFNFSDLNNFLEGAENILFS